MAMKTKISMLIIVKFLLLTTTLLSQQSDFLKYAPSHPAQIENRYVSNYLGRGISINYGFGNYAVRDEFLATEKYSGAIPFFSIGWTNYSDSNGFRILFSVHSSDKIANKNMAADVLNFSLIWDYLYHVKTFQLFSKDWMFFAGPSAEMYLYTNKQNYATDGIFFNISFATLISIGGNASLLVPITENLICESSLRTNIFSLGMRMPLLMEIDGAENDKSRLKLLTPFKAINSQFDLGLRYLLSTNLSLKAVYRFQFTSISAWEKLSSASDHFVFSLSFNF